MENHTQTLSFLTLAVAVFFVGAIFMRDCSGTRKYLDELQKVKASYQDIQLKIDSLYTHSRKQQDSMLHIIDSAYGKLGAIQEKRAAVTEAVNRKYRRQRTKAPKPGVSGFQFNP